MRTVCIDAGTIICLRIWRDLQSDVNRSNSTSLLATHHTGELVSMIDGPCGLLWD